jgi:hypothetical protein
MLKPELFVHPTVVRMPYRRGHLVAGFDRFLIDFLASAVSHSLVPDVIGQYARCARRRGAPAVLRTGRKDPRQIF